MNHDLTTLNVLIFEDSIDDLELCVRALKKIHGTNYNVTHARHGKQGLEILKTYMPDCVLLDYQLPGNDGLNVLKDIKASYPELPVVILTGHGSDFIAAQMIKHGAYDYIIKSEITSCTIKKTIANALKQYNKNTRKNQTDLTDHESVILIVDDNQDDREMYIRSLQKTNTKKYRCREVTNGETLFQVLNTGEIPDCILLDYSLPGKNGLVLLKEIKALFNYIPVIMLTGQGNERVAVQAIKEGAYDYLVKSDITKDSLDRAVSAATKGFRLERQLEETTAKLQKSNQFNQAIMNSSTHLLIATDLKGTVTFFNKAAELALGYKAEDIVGKETPALWHDLSEVQKKAEELSILFGKPVESDFDVFRFIPLKKGSDKGEWTFIRKDKTRFPATLTVTRIKNNDKETVGFLFVIEDISVQKIAQQKARDSTELMELILENSPLYLFVKDKNFNIVKANSNFLSLYSEEMKDRVIGHTTLEDYSEEEANEFLEMDRLAFEKGYSNTVEAIHFPNGDYRKLYTQKVRFENAAGAPYILGICYDVTENEREMQLLRQLQAISIDIEKGILEKVQSALQAGCEFFDVTLGVICQQNDTQLTVLHSSNPEILKTQTVFSINKDRAGLFNRNNVNISPNYGSRTHVELYPLGENLDMPTFIESSIDINRNFSGIIKFCSHKELQTPFSEKEIAMFEVLTQWISHRLSDHISTQQKNELIETLYASNTELARFAYVCSHDLQEPFRMVKSFTDKLSMHIADIVQQDEKAKKYFHFIQDGASRAQQLIEGVLEYSKLDHETKYTENIDVNTILETIKNNVMSNFEPSDIKIHVGPMPEVFGNRTQIHQLFQNLIHNALKFQSDINTPEIKICCEELENHWRFSVQDNGIGMDSRQHKKIFDIFQRLHTRTRYHGAGIGLSICKKIVERHGGKIWVESTEGAGSTFFFTIIKSYTEENNYEYNRQAC